MVLDIVKATIGNFTVDNTVNEVPMNVFSDAVFNPATATVPDYFEGKDNLKILSMGYWFPYCFVPSVDFWAGKFNWLGEGNPNSEDYVVKEFSDTDGRLYIPLQANDFELNVFVKYPSLKNTDPDTKKSFSVTSDVIYISQIGAPDSLHGETLQVHMWAKIIHTLPMVI